MKKFLILIKELIGLILYAIGSFFLVLVMGAFIIFSFIRDSFYRFTKKFKRE